MNKFLRVFLTGILMVVCMDTAVAKVVNKIEGYGIYVVAKNGYVKVESYSHYDNFVDFRYLNEIPFVERSSDEVRIVVYEQGFTEGGVRFEMRPVDVTVRIDEVKFTVKPLEKKDMYELTLNKPVPDGAMLHVYSGFYDNMGVIMLGSTQDVLVDYFGKKDLKNASAVEQYLADALVAFPANNKLKTLDAYWKKAAEDEKDESDYVYVEEEWKKYEEAEKLTLKSRYLEKALVEINGYLDTHPDGRKAPEAKARRSEAENKLKEYEKLL